MRRGSLLVLAAAGILVVAPSADARVTQTQVTTKQSPTFGGHSFAGVGSSRTVRHIVTNDHH
jgi:hypothetical protein